MMITNLVEFRRNLSVFLEKASKDAEVIGVDWEGGDVVVMSGEAYRGLLETIRLTRIPGMKEKLLDGMQTPIEECDDFAW